MYFAYQNYWNRFPIQVRLDFDSESSWKGVNRPFRLQFRLQWEKICCRPIAANSEHNPNRFWRHIGSLPCAAIAVVKKSRNQGSWIACRRHLYVWSQRTYRPIQCITIAATPIDDGTILHTKWQTFSHTWEPISSVLINTIRSNGIFRHYQGRSAKKPEKCNTKKWQQFS